MITLIEYDTANKPTGRFHRMPDTTRQTLADLLMLYGSDAAINQHTGELRGYSPDRWCFVYQSSMPGAVGVDVGLEGLLAP